MIVFKEIEILGLFGESDVRIPISNNRLIMVGYNGIGKSTILNIFYYFISQQWHKLIDLEFTSLTVRIKAKNRKLSVNRTALVGYIETRKRGRRLSKYGHRFTNRMLRDAYELVHRGSEIADRPIGFSASKSRMRHDIDVIRGGLDVPWRIAEEIYHQVRYVTQNEIDFDDKDHENIAKVDEFISDNIEGRILYLPTYRRIEKDIKTVFPEIEEELRRQLTRRSHENSGNETYIELVQFGMEDVKEKIDSRLEDVKAYALAQINSLTTKYLRDVIRDEANHYEEIEALQINEAALSAVFSKVDSDILSDEDKHNITGVVVKIRKGDTLLENEKYVAHYVLYLVEVGKNIAELEKPILSFVELCNSYLYGKSFRFDSVSYKVKIIHDSHRPVEMEELSSGEKQIVSLFSHLILDQNDINYIVIDEPELSLSVEWQQRFLEDISQLDTCAFIGAVTHSPFIFENSLNDYAIDLLEHTSPS